MIYLDIVSDVCMSNMLGSSPPNLDMLYSTPTYFVPEQSLVVLATDSTVIELNRGKTICLFYRFILDQWEVHPETFINLFKRLSV